MTDTMETEHIHPLKLFELAKSQKRFLYTSAPMVRYSKLAFRKTVHEYGTDLCWTPMILAKEFNRNQFARDSDFTISTPQPPTIVQFGANVPLELARASSLVAPFASGVDLNCGCPQSWACAETLGAALMEKRELVRDMVVATRAQLRRDGWAVGLERDVDDPEGKGRSVSVKIRVHKDLRKTMDFITTVLGPAQDRNIDFLTIHPRTRATPSSAPIDVSALEVLTSTFGKDVPILVSGDVFTLGTLPYTSPVAPLARSDGEGEEQLPTLPHLAGLMSARAILANPALYAGHDVCPWEAVDTFLNHAVRCPLPFKLVLHHLGEMCGPGFGPDKSALLSRKERARMMGCLNMVDLIDFMDGKRMEKGGGGEVVRRETGEGVVQS